jgi:5'-deoxynucleotidase YfbR-like HD superfamily hydrolase
MKKLVEFLFECLHLKDIKREGWRYAGIQFPESVAEHTLHAAQIGFILAQLE